MECEYSFLPPSKKDKLFSGLPPHGDFDVTPSLPSVRPMNVCTVNCRSPMYVVCVVNDPPTLRRPPPAPLSIDSLPPPSVNLLSRLPKLWLDLVYLLLLQHSSEESPRCQSHFPRRWISSSHHCSFLVKLQLRHRRPSLLSVPRTDRKSVV